MKTETQPTNYSTCTECGHTWPWGTDGEHSCVRRLQERVAELEAQFPKPETFEAHGHTWTKHTPGDPMPCDGESYPIVIFVDMGVSAGIYQAKDWLWNADNNESNIIGWRYADKPEPSELDKLRSQNEDLNRSNASLLNLLADIRAAVGDPSGKLMQDELVAHCKNMRAALQLAHNALLMADDDSDYSGHGPNLVTQALAALQPLIMPTK